MYEICSKLHQSDIIEVVLVSLLLTFNRFHICSSVSFVDFEQVNAGWVTVLNTHLSIDIEYYELIIPVDTRRCFNVYTTSLTSYRRRIDVEMTPCVYWDSQHAINTPKLYVSNIN